MGDKLIKIIDGVLSTPRPKSTYKLKPAFKPSMLGAKCLRKLYYSYNRIDEDYEFPVKAKKIMLVGDSIHDTITKTFRKAGIIIDYVQKNGKVAVNRHTGEPDLEFPLKDKDLQLSAKIDAVVVLDGQLFLVEIKSINQKGFKSLKKPKDEHLIQGITYYYCFNRALAEGAYSHIKALDPYKEAKGVIFFYVNKDDSDFKEYEVTGGAEVFRAIIDKMNQILRHTKVGQLPPKTYDWCDSCQWRKKCVQNKLK